MFTYSICMWASNMNKKNKRMVSELSVCFISCYCCYWATDKAGTPLTCESNRAKKKQEKENRRNSQKYKAWERGKQMFVMRKRRKKERKKQTEKD